MTAETMKRRLTTLLHADVKGYSRLVSEDEVATVHTLTEYRNVLVDFVKAHEGRIVDTAGDGFLVEFPSVISALDCAVEFQRDINTRNLRLPENRKMEFRIGIDVGEVIEQADKIFGDGVNIAARLEGLAEGGGICISGNAYDQVKKRSRSKYQYLGEKTLKNIGQPVRVYRVLMATTTLLPENGPPRSLNLRRWAIRLAFATAIFLVVAIGLWVWQSYVRPVLPPSESQSLQKPVSAATDIPSIAVLPFTNLSGDPEQEYFSRRHHRRNHHYLVQSSETLRDRKQLFFRSEGEGHKYPASWSRIAREIRVGRECSQVWRQRSGHCSTH